jgi:hypothetical protein
LHRAVVERILFIDEPGARHPQPLFAGNDDIQRLADYCGGGLNRGTRGNVEAEAERWTGAGGREQMH